MQTWNRNRFRGIVRSYPEGSEITIEVERGGEKIPLHAKLIRWWTGGARKLAPDAMKPGLGVKLNPDPPVTGGAEIREVLPNSAASKGGLKKGDIILLFDGKQVLGPADLEGMVDGVYEELPPRGSRKNTDVRLKFLRGLEEKEIKVTLGPRPE
jgi:S1-C subfamily serine protease